MGRLASHGGLGIWLSGICIGCLCAVLTDVSAKEHAPAASRASDSAATPVVDPNIAVDTDAAGARPAVTNPAADTAESSTYPLDSEPRVLDRSQPLPCDRYPLVSYDGDRIKYASSARVFPAFVERLRRMEAVIAELSIRYYGRQPRRLVHLGTHNCRRIRTYPDWLSEHTFGNAIDLAGLDFGPVRPATLPETSPRALRHAFKVRLLDHWNGRGSTNAYHSRFLRDLAQQLIDRRDIFRGILGPAWPGHRNHFHLDMAPYRVVEVFEAEPTSTAGAR